MPTWSPDGKYIAYVTWSADGGQLNRVLASPGSQPERLSRYAAYYAEPAYSPDGSKIVFIVGTTSDQLYADLHYTDRDVEPDGAPAEIEGIQATGDLDLRWMPSSGGDSTLVGATKGGHSPHFADDSTHVYLTSNHGLTSIRIDGFDRREIVQLTGVGAGPNPPEASEIRMSPDGQQAFVSLQNRHVIVRVPRVGKDVVKISVKGKEDSVVPIKRLSREGGQYLSWSPDGKSVSWALGNTIYRQALASDTPEEFHPVVEAPRARPHGTIVLDRRAHRHDEGRRGDRKGRPRRHRQPHRRGRRERQGDTTGGREGDRRRRQDDHPRLRRRPLAHVAAAGRAPDRGVAVPGEPRLRRDDDTRPADVHRRRVRVFRSRRYRRDSRAAHPGDGPGHLQQRRPRGQGDDGRVHQALQGIVQDRHDQGVHRRRSHRPSVGDSRGEKVQAHADDRGRARHEAGSVADDRRLHRLGAQPADPAALQGRHRVRREVAHVLYADDARRVRGAVDGELLLREHAEAARGSEDAAVHPARAVRHDGAAARAVVPPR